MKKLLLILAFLSFASICFAATYNISTLAELQAISPTHLNDNCQLLADIDATATSGWNGGAGFIPISTFTGSFNGQGHTITNLFIYRPTTDNVGLFGSVNPSGSNFIKNVGLISVNITGKNKVGGLTGYNETIVPLSISDCYVTGTVKGGYQVGGLVGNIYPDQDSVTITDCYATADVTGLDFVGGLVGNIIYGENYVYIVTSHATGDIKAYSTEAGGGVYAGGLVGNNSASGVISNSYATGYVSADLGSAGGLVGISDGVISNSYATGYVISQDQVGGLVSRNYGDISNCYATGDVDGSTNYGGLVGKNYQTIAGSYATGEINGANYGGGLVGYNEGTITNCYTDGARVGGSSYTGGLVGQNTNGGTITNCYSSKNVTSGSYKGGLVGNNGVGCTIKNSYSVGTISAGTDHSGGLVGNDNGTIINCGWWTGCGQTNAIGFPAGDVTYNESLKSAFYNKTHNLYDTGTPVWDFATPVWYQWTNNFPLFRKYKGQVIIID